MPDRAKIFDDKKFMWDGLLYDTEKDAEEKNKTYEKDDFETRMIPGEGEKFLLYTRRVVSEVKAG